MKIRLFLVFGLLAALHVPLVEAQQTTVQMVLTQPYTDTKLQVFDGETLTVTASGTMNWFTGGCGGKCLSTPDGQACPYTGFVAQGLPCWSLIGKIGPNGKPFEVGASLTFKANSSGQFFLGVNDNNYPDNTGSWTAEITIACSLSQLTFDPNDASYHRYPIGGGTIETQLCAKADKNCTREEVFRVFLSNSQFIAPTSDTQPVTNCKVTMVDISRFGLENMGIGIGGNPIQSIVNLQNYSVTNFTLPGHLLYPGKVVRTITEDSQYVLIETWGEGTGLLPTLNAFFAPGLWQEVDRGLRYAVIRDTFHLGK